MSVDHLDDGATPADERQANGGEFVQSLERGLAVIRAFDAEHAELTLSDVARITGLTRAAARRFLHTLVELGYVRGNGRLFALRPRVLDLGFAYLSSLGLPEVASPHLESLVATVHESCSVAVLDGDEVVYVARVATRRIMSVAVSVGTRFPAYATSLGRVLLAGQSDEWLEGYLATVRLTRFTSRTIDEPARLRAEIARVRGQGWAIVDEELEEGLRSIAAPIHDALGKVIAAANVSSPTRRGDLDTLRDELLPFLLDAVRRIEEDLHAVTPAGRA